MLKEKKARLRNPKKEMELHVEGNLVGGFNPFEKYARQIVSFPQVAVKIKKKHI